MTVSAPASVPAEARRSPLGQHTQTSGSDSFRGNPNLRQTTPQSSNHHSPVKEIKKLKKINTFFNSYLSTLTSSIDPDAVVSLIFKPAAFVVVQSC